MKLKILALLTILLLTACKNNEEPDPTLAERAGTYEGGGYTVIASSGGQIQIIQNSLQVGFALFNASSREDDFNVGTYKVELDNNSEINDIPLSKINNTGTIRLTLEQRAGTYNATTGGFSVVVASDGTITSLFESKKFNTTSTDTTFIIITSITIVFKSLNEAVIQSQGNNISCLKN